MLRDDAAAAKAKQLREWFSRDLERRIRYVMRREPMQCITPRTVAAKYKEQSPDR